MDLLSALRNVVQVVPSGFLGVVALQIVEGYVEQRSGVIDVQHLREGHAAGWTFRDVFGMADPQLQQILVTIARRAPGILDELSFQTLLKWTGRGNPQLVSALVRDQDLLAWAKQSWASSIADFRRLALTPQEAGA